MLAVWSGFFQCRMLGGSIFCSVSNAVKSGNLSICFLGFARHGQTRAIRSSSEIGTLAATFDYVTDEKKFDRLPISKFFSLSATVLGKDNQLRLEELLRQKQAGNLAESGLERGVFALELIERHISPSKPRLESDYLERVGINTQIADDILDYENDIKTDHLNFLKGPLGHEYLDRFLIWDWRAEFQTNPNTFVLFFVLNKAQKKAVYFRKNLKISKNSQADMINMLKTSAD